MSGQQSSLMFNLDRDDAARGLMDAAEIFCQIGELMDPPNPGLPIGMVKAVWNGKYTLAYVRMGLLTTEVLDHFYRLGRSPMSLERVETLLKDLPLRSSTIDALRDIAKTYPTT